SVDSKYSGMGTASKSWDNSTFNINVTAFLDKTAKGKSYYVYLKGNGSDLQDMNLGKMQLSGDVYALNFTSDKNLFAYKEVFVTIQTDAESTNGKLGKIVLSGTFTK